MERADQLASSLEARDGTQNRAYLGRTTPEAYSAADSRGPAALVRSNADSDSRTMLVQPMSGRLSITDRAQSFVTEGLHLGVTPEAYALAFNQKRTREKFDGVHMPPRPKNITPAVVEKGPEPRPSEHPYREARDANHGGQTSSKEKEPEIRSQRRHPSPTRSSVEAVQAPDESTPFLAGPIRARFQAPLMDSNAAPEVYKQLLDTSFTLPLRQLLAVAPEVRGKLREGTTPKRVALDESSGEKASAPTAPALAHMRSAWVEEVQDEEGLALPGMTADAFAFRSFGAERMNWASNQVTVEEVVPESELRVALAMESLRAVEVTVNHEYKAEAILDGGSSIIPIAEDLCRKLGLAWDPAARVRMQSANGEMDGTLGAVENVPLLVGGLLFYVQLHVVPKAPFDILLGRPFFTLARASLETYHDNEEDLTITDPNSKQTRTLPTHLSRGRTHRQRDLNAQAGFQHLGN